MNAVRTVSTKGTEAVPVPHWPRNARRLHDAVAVETALAGQAARLAPGLEDRNPLILVVMTGGMYPAAALTRHFGFALTLDYAHATRYRGETTGGHLEWTRRPDESVIGRHVLIVDDIFDEGYTLQAVVEACRGQGAVAVTTAVLVRKQHDRGLPRDWIDDAALDVPDTYVFGCGMDYREHWRQLPDIWALE